MTHPQIPAIKELLKPIAENFDLQLVEVVFQTNKQPPVLRIDIQSNTGDTGLADCEKMSREIESQLDSESLMDTAYVLEVSSPGVSNVLSSDREFNSFKGFPVIVETKEPYKKLKRWQGRLQGRDNDAVHIHKKGKKISIPRNLISIVSIDEGA